MALSQEGNRIDLSGNAYCGAPSDTASGTLQGNRLRLEGQHIRGRLPSALVLDLTYHPETGHLTGTRNGKPVWLARHGACPSPAVLCSIDIEGDLYDEGGTLIVDKAKVSIKSLNPSTPYENNLDVRGAHYRASGIALGGELEVTVEVEGQGKVSRRETPKRGPVWVVNFGGPQDVADPEGWRYWVKPRPGMSTAP